MQENKLIILGHSNGGVPILMDLAFELFGYSDFDILKNIDLPDCEFPSDLYKAAHYFEQNYKFNDNKHLKVHFGVQHPSIKYLLHHLYRDKHNVQDDRFIDVIHSSTYIAPSAQYGGGLMAEPNAVISSMAKVGFGVTVKRSASIGHHAILGDYVNINPGAILSGFVEIGFASEIGTGAVISNNIKIGERSLIGAGSVVTRDIPDGVIAFGNPCKPIRDNERWNTIPYPYISQTFQV